MKPLLFALALAWSQSAVAGVVTQPDPLPRAVVVDQDTLATLDPVSLSANFVDRVIHGLPVDAHLELFRNLEAAALEQALPAQPQQLAFWLNIYNGYTQYFLQTDPTLYLESRPDYFSREQVPIAGAVLSLEQIEHGILRRGATIYTLGHIRLLFFRRAMVRQFAVDQVDYRIHFALNCGALSCPPVLAYRAETVDAQLDAISRYYLQQEAHYSAENDEVAVPALLRWFSADFGSRQDKREILRKHGVLPAGVKPALRYRDYDWTLKIRNYALFQPE
ncbi:MAG: DUF547 domain-containing protein [Oceanococcaceae bacterium]